MRTAFLLIAWFLVILALAVTGAFEALWNGQLMGPALALLVPLCLYFLDVYWLRSKLFGGFWTLDESSAIAIQAYRVVGAFFLAELWRGGLPPAFAVPAGLGDVLVGVLAPGVAWRLGGNKPYARAVAVAWNLLGILDLVSAISLGILYGPTPFGVLANGITAGAVTQYPLCLIPYWVVPLSLMLHFRSLQGLLQGASPARGRNITLLVAVSVMVTIIIAVGASVSVARKAPMPDRQSTREKPTVTTTLQPFANDDAITVARMLDDGRGRLPERRPDKE
jgi:hypothetical protein